MRESKYQLHVVQRLELEFPGCLVIRNDPRLVQGIQDLLVLFRDRWAALEVKISSTAPERPNQRHYVERLNEMSYSTFIFPENEDEVFNELQLALGNRRKARVLKSKHIPLD
jgi:hypothetical protein